MQITPEMLEKHSYHDIVICQYDDDKVALECNDCDETLASAIVAFETRKKVNGVFRAIKKPVRPR